MDRQPQSYPACQNRFIPWNVGKISTSSCIHCPCCKAALNRRRDLQFFAVLIPEIAAITLICSLPITMWQQVLLYLLIGAVCYIVDAVTVRLVRVED